MIKIYISFYGNKLIPYELGQEMGLDIIKIFSYGEYPKYGKFKDIKSPHGFGVLKFLEKENNIEQIFISLDKLINILSSNKDVLSKHEVTEIVVKIQGEFILPKDIQIEFDKLGVYVEYEKILTTN